MEVLHSLVPVKPHTAVTTVRLPVRPRHCDAQAMLHASRYYEYYEDAILAGLDEHVGGYQKLQQSGVDLVIIESGSRHHLPARLNDVLAIEVRPLALTTSSIKIQFRGVLDTELVALGTTTCVAVNAAGKAPLPESIRKAANGQTNL